MANGQNMTAEEFTTSVAEAIAAQLKIDASALVTRLVESLSKGLIKEFTKKGPLLAEKSKTTETSKATKQDSAKLPKIELALPKIIETQIGKLDDINKSLSKLIDKTATVKKEDQFPGLLKKLVPKEPTKPEVPRPDTSFNVLGNTFQKILGTFAASFKKQEPTVQTLNTEPKQAPVLSLLPLEAPKPETRQDTSLNALQPEPLKVETKQALAPPLLPVEAPKVEAKTPDSSISILGTTFRKILDTFKAPSKKEEVISKKSLEEAPKPDTSLNVLGGTLQKILDATKSSSKKEGAKETSKPEAPKSLLEQKVDAQPVIIAGLSESGIKDLSEHLPDIIREGMKGLLEDLKAKEEKKKDGGGFGLPGLGIVAGALGVLSTIGGLFTLLYGLQTDGPYKGLAKIVGKGLLGIGNALTKPLQNFIKKIGKFLIDIPINLIKKAGTMLSASFKEFGDSASKLGSSKLIAPVKDFAKGIMDKLIAIPMKMLSTFKSSVGGLFGKVGGGAIKTGLGKLTGFLPKMMGGLLKVFKKVPIVGSLISIAFAVSRFKSGDYVGGGLEILSGLAAMIPGVGTMVSIAIDALNAFLDFKAGGIGEGKPSKGGMLMDWVGGMVKWVGQKLYKVITFLPIVGPALKSVEALTQGKWLDAIKQFAYINPAFEFLGAMLGDESTGGTMQATAGFAGGIMEWVGGMSAWIGEKLLELPIIGPAIKAVQALFAGDFTEALKQFQHINPLVGMLEQFLQTDTGKDVSKKVSGGFSKAMDFFSDMKNNILNKVLEFIPETVWGYPLRAKVSELFGLGPKANIPESQPVGAEVPSEPAPPVKQVGDAKIKADGGLVVSSPTEGSLFQLSKNDGVGIVAAPVAEDAKASSASERLMDFPSFDNDSLKATAYEAKVTNKKLDSLGNGFNALAKSLERLGASVANQSPTVVNNIAAGGKGGSPKVNASQIASAGNNTISNFRAGVEASRFVPA